MIDACFTSSSDSKVFDAFVLSFLSFSRYVSSWSTPCVWMSSIAWFSFMQAAVSDIALKYIGFLSFATIARSFPDSSRSSLFESCASFMMFNDMRNFSLFVFASSRDLLIFLNSSGNSILTHSTLVVLIYGFTSQSSSFLISTFSQ